LEAARSSGDVTSFVEGRSEFLEAVGSFVESIKFCRRSVEIFGVGRKVGMYLEVLKVARSSRDVDKLCGGSVGVS